MQSDKLKEYTDLKKGTYFQNADAVWQPMKEKEKKYRLAFTARNAETSLRDLLVKDLGELRPVEPPPMIAAQPEPQRELPEELKLKQDSEQTNKTNVGETHPLVDKTEKVLAETHATSKPLRPSKATENTRSANVDTVAGRLPLEPTVSPKSFVYCFVLKDSKHNQPLKNEEVGVTVKTRLENKWKEKKDREKIKKYTNYLEYRTEFAGPISFTFAHDGYQESKPFIFTRGILDASTEKTELRIVNAYLKPLTSEYWIVAEILLLEKISADEFASLLGSDPHQVETGVVPPAESRLPPNPQPPATGKQSPSPASPTAPRTSDVTRDGSETQKSQTTDISTSSAAFRSINVKFNLEMSGYVPRQKVLLNIKSRQKDVIVRGNTDAWPPTDLISTIIQFSGENDREVEIALEISELGSGKKYICEIRSPKPLLLSHLTKGTTTVSITLFSK